MKDKFGIIKNEKFGYYELSPTPTENDLEEYYESGYYENIKKDGGTHEAKFLDDTNERKKELIWMEETYYKDAYYNFKSYLEEIKVVKILDIGCGSGEFLKYFKDRDYIVYGIEPAKTAYEKALEKGINTYYGKFKDYICNNKGEKFNVINMSGYINLEIDSEFVLRQVRKILTDNGIIRIECSNEFNKFQIIANECLDIEKWWVCKPNHITYFNIESLEKLLNYCGFEIIKKTSDFPMSMFLLMGFNYIEDKELGKKCHEARRKFELLLPDELRRDFYDKLLELGIGRKLIVYAKKKE